MFTYAKRFYKQFIEPFPDWLSDQADALTDWVKNTKVDTDDLYDIGTSPARDYVKDFMESDWDEDKYAKYLVLRNSQTLGSFFKAYEALEDNRQYMNRYGLTWDDTKFVWRLPGTEKASSATYSNVFRPLNFVSSNLKRLYR